MTSRSVSTWDPRPVRRMCLDGNSRPDTRRTPPVGRYRYNEVRGGTRSPRETERDSEVGGTGSQKGTWRTPTPQTVDRFVGEQGGEGKTTRLCAQNQQSTAPVVEPNHFVPRLRGEGTWCKGVKSRDDTCRRRRARRLPPGPPTSRRPSS